MAVLNIKRGTAGFIEAGHMDGIIDEFAKRDGVRARLLFHGP